MKSNLFLSYMEYRAYMARKYPGWSVLPYRKWFDLRGWE